MISLCKLIYPGLINQPIALILDSQDNKILLYKTCRWKLSLSLVLAPAECCRGHCVRWWRGPFLLGLSAFTFFCFWYGTTLSRREWGQTGRGRGGGLGALSLSSRTMPPTAFGRRQNRRKWQLSPKALMSRNLFFYESKFWVTGWSCNEFGRDR